MIPPVIHRWWTGPPSPLEPWLGNTLRALHPGWAIHDWTDQTLPFPIDDNPGLVNLDQRIRHRSNVIRYHLLARYGGWWLDSDLVLLRPLAELPQVPTVASLRGQPEGCLMGASPGYPDLIDLAADATTPGRPPFAAYTSGAKRLLAFTASWRQEPGVLPFDATGAATGVPDPIGVHLWLSSHHE